MGTSRVTLVRLLGMLVSLVLLFTSSGLQAQSLARDTSMRPGDAAISPDSFFASDSSSGSTGEGAEDISSFIVGGDPDVVSILYRFCDFGNDWQSQHPEWGPIGSIQYCLWKDINPAPGVYNWNVIEAQLNKERNLTVTLLDGQVVPKPVVLQILPHASEADGWSGAYFYDATPEWVYDQIDAQNPDHPRPVVNGRKVGYRLEDNGAVAVMPMYENATWQRAYWDCVRAFGERYNGRSQVTSVIVTTGLDGETHPIKDAGGHWKAIAEANIPGLYNYFSSYVLATMDVYREAFPGKAIFISSAPGDSGLRKSVASHAASLQPPVGLKHAGMWVDQDSHQGYGSFVGSWDMIRAYSTTLPIWLESAYGFGSAEDKYWSLLAGLHYHPDAIDVHPDFLTQTDPAILRWVSAHLGRTPYDTPSVWTVLRDSEYPQQSWGGGACSGHVGDWTFWLTRQEIEGGRTVRIWREEMPAEARGQIYSRQARRTDQANGQEYIYLDVDNQYPYAGQIPANEPGGNVSYTIKVTFINQGDDTLSLEYKNYQGELVSQTVQKGAALGPVNTWVSHVFTVFDAYLHNNLGNGKADFRLSCNGDGDEIVHLIEVEGHWQGTPPPTPTPLPTRTAMPSATPTLVSTPTLTAPPSATATALTPTATPAIGPQLGPGEALILEDTTILEVDPATTHGRQPSLVLRGDGSVRALLRFGLGPVPAGASLSEATLRLQSTTRSGSPLAVEVYGLLRPWGEEMSTWQQARWGLPWAHPGADNPAQDRETMAAGTAIVQGGEVWYEWDITSLAQRWLSGKQENQGIILIAAGDPDSIYTFSSREGPFTPELVLRFLSPTATSTVAATATATPRPLPTRTPTNTPLPTPTPTAKPKEEPKAKPSPTPTSVPTNTPTNIPLPTPTPTEKPKEEPKAEPSFTPTSTPLPAPTPTAKPTEEPQAEPSPTPTSVPTGAPTSTPTSTPTLTATATATDTPMSTTTATNAPTATATDTPTAVATATATATDTPTATATGNVQPTSTLTATPVVDKNLLAGRVIERPQGGGVEGATVRLYIQAGNDGWQLLKETVTDHTGAFAWLVERGSLLYRVVELDPEGYTSVGAVIPPTIPGRVIDANTIELLPSDKPWSDCLFVDKPVKSKPTADPTHKPKGTPTALPTATAQVTATPKPEATDKPKPKATATPEATATPIPGQGNEGNTGGDNQNILWGSQKGEAATEDDAHHQKKDDRQSKASAAEKAAKHAEKFIQKKLEKMKRHDED